MAATKVSDPQNYILKDAKPTGVELGKGSYGSVLEFKTCGVLCAGKKIHDVLLDVEGEGLKCVVDRFKQECQLLASLRHPNVVQYLGLAFLPDSSLPCLLMERLYCSLDDYLESQQNIAFFIKSSILLDVSSGLMYLHEHDPPVIHRDLTSKNVLLTPSMRAKLADLGNSRLIDQYRLSKTMTAAPGTSVYMPPEALQQSSHYSPKLDIFSFGHLSLYVLTETFPGDLLPPNEPDSKNQDKLIPRTEIKRREKYFTILRSKLSQKRHQQLVNLVEQCLHNSPARRPTAVNLHSHLEALSVDSDDDPGAIYIEVAKMEFQKKARLNKSLEVGAEKTIYRARDKIGMLKQHKSSGRIRGRGTIVILKIFMGKYLQVLKQHGKNSKPQKEVELSDIDKIEIVPGEDFVFKVYFKDATKSPWKFSALSEEERSSWIAALNTSIRGETMYQHQPKKEDVGAGKQREEVESSAEKQYSLLDPDKTWVPIPSHALQFTNPREDNYRLSPTNTEEGLYDIPIDDDISPKQRARTRGFSRILEERRQCQLLLWPKREICPIPSDPNYDLYETVGDVYLPPASESRRDVPLPLPTSNQDQDHRQAVQHQWTNAVNEYHDRQQCLSSPNTPRPQFSSPPKPLISPTLAKKASQYFDPQQVSLLMQMFQQLEGYLGPEYEEVPSHPSNTLKSDTGVCESQSTKHSPEQMLLTEDEPYIERPQWAKASAAVTNSMELSEVEEDALTILPSALSGFEKIGNGQFGKVYKAILQNSEGENIQVAMKTIKVYSEGEMRNFKREMAVMSKLMHPNIVQLFGYVQEGEYAPSIVLEFHAHGDLKTFLMGNKCTHHQLMKYMVDVAMGMHYISERGLIHRDLAARNVLVGANGTCKISDFGLLRELPRDDSIYTSQSDMPCPTRWMAPESIKKRQFSTASDVWSYGVLQWEMFNPSKIPYSNMDNVQCALNVSQGYTLPIPRGCPSIVAKIMRSCWSQVPPKRPSFFLIVTTLSKATL